LPEEDDEAWDEEPVQSLPASETTQFRGRPGPGRPSGAKGRKKIVEAILLEPREVREHGRARRLPVIEILLKLLRNASLDSDIASNFLEGLQERYAPPSREPRHILAIFPEKLPYELWEQRFGHLRDRESHLGDHSPVKPPGKDRDREVPESSE
jgi:hypothetical protein